MVLYLTNKKGESCEALLDAEDFSKLDECSLSWHLKWDEDINSYYVKATQYLGVNHKPVSKTIHLHRFIMDAQPGEYVDHKNHNTLDNRKSNLIKTTARKNSYNRKSANNNSRSGVRNVHWSEKRKCWTVQFWFDGKNHVVKTFSEENLEDAKQFADENRKGYYENLM